eukprot:4333694-Pleurochrysis_carterae.AAC.3
MTQTALAAGQRDVMPDEREVEGRGRFTPPCQLERQACASEVRMSTGGAHAGARSGGMSKGEG